MSSDIVLNNQKKSIELMQGVKTKSSMPSVVTAASTSIGNVNLNNSGNIISKTVSNGIGGFKFAKQQQNITSTFEMTPTAAQQTSLNSGPVRFIDHSQIYKKQMTDANQKWF